MPNIKHKTDDETLDKIIAAAYKDANLIDRIKIYFITKQDDKVKKIFNEYRAAAKAVKQIPLDECPGSIIESIKVKTVKEKNSALKPVYMFAVSLIVVLSFIAVFWFQNKDTKRVYSTAEIELAEKQVKESFVIVNRVFKKTEKLIQNDILQKRVGKPVRQSLSIINEVLIGG